MTRLGLHCGRTDVVVAILDDSGALADAGEARLEAGFGTISEAPDAFSDAFGRALSELGAAQGDRITVVVPHPFIHLRRIPLEFAGERDRIDQIAWEAAQTLFANPEDLIVEHWAAGSSATWQAYRSVLRDCLRAGCNRAGCAVARICSEPIALYDAIRSDSRVEHAGAAAISEYVASTAAGSQHALWRANTFAVTDRAGVAELIAARLLGRSERLDRISLFALTEGAEALAPMISESASCDVQLTTAQVGGGHIAAATGARAALAAAAARYPSIYDQTISEVAP